MARTSGTRPKGQGPGWGGPAKGAGVGGPAVPFTADSPLLHTMPGGPGVLGAVGDPVKKLNREEKAAITERRADAAWARMDDMVGDPTHPSHYLAVRETLNRVDGMPVARNINLTVNDMSALSDADLDAEIARLARAEGGAGHGAEGAASAELPG